MKRSNGREFSKIVLAVCVGLYIVVVIVGVCVVVPDHDHIGEFFEFVKTPTSVAIGFYAWKAKSENIIKYNKNQIEKLNQANNGGTEGDINGIG